MVSRQETTLTNRANSSHRRQGHGRHSISMCLLMLLVVLLASHRVGAQDAAKSGSKPIREIFVPFDDLPVLLEGHDQHVFLTRAEYEELLSKAQLIPPEEKSPRSRVILSADYDGTIQEGRANIRGTIVLETVSDQLMGIALPFRGVSLRSAELDGQPAALARAQDGTPILFVQGKGKHELKLEMIAPVIVTAAEQRLQVQFATPAATHWRMTVPGNVDVRGGAPVIKREVDATAGVTHFELLPQRGPTTLIMSLNNRIQLQERVILARSVLVDEVTQSFERLHATVSLAIPHGAVDRFRFTLPPGFEVTEVGTPSLARWAVQPGENGQHVLEVVLREATTETVVLNIVAVNNAPAPAEWTMPQLRPLDVAGHVAVVGVVAEDRLAAQSIAPAGLIPIDVSVLNAALPASVLKAEPGATRIRPVAAYYAPQADYGLTASFLRSTARVDVTSNLLFILNDQRLQLRGGFALLPAAEKIFSVDITVPAAWQVTEVTQNDGAKLPYEVFAGENGATRLQIKLLQGAAPGSFFNLFVHAKSAPPGWLNEWSRSTISFPAFAVMGAQRDIGAIAVQSNDDITVRPDQLNGLTPLAEKEKAEFGLGETATNLAYRYESQPYNATLTVERNVPRITARTFQFLRVEPEGLLAHYELLYNVEQARARRLTLRLPVSTPADITIRGLDVAVKEYRSEVVNGERRWTAELSEPRSGLVRLVVEFQQSLPSDAPRNFVLPLVTADGVVYQSGTVAVEGNAEFDIAVKTEARRVDVGELVDAEYQVGTRLLGAYGFVADTATVLIDVFRRPDYGLPAAIVQRAELVTLLSAQGLSQSAARYQLRTKALFLEFTLPANSTLWSATVDGKPTAPQREGDHLLIGLPPTGVVTPRDLQIVYETPVNALLRWGSITAAAPRLLLRDEKGGAGVEVPMADLVWTLVLPEGHRVVRAGGTVFTDRLAPPPPPLSVIGAVMYDAGGGAAHWRQRSGADSRAGLARNYYEDDMDMNAEAAPKAPARAMGFQRDGAVESATPPPTAQPTDQMFGVEAQRETTVASPEKPQDRAPEGDRSRVTAEEGARLHDHSLLYAQDARSKTDVSQPRVTPPGADAAVSQAASTTKKVDRFWALQGVRSLPIELVQSGEQLTFTSMGIDPKLNVVLASARSLWFLAALIAILVGLFGLARTNQPWQKQVQFVIVAIVVTLGVPALMGIGTDIEVSEVFHPAFFVACALVPWYLLVAMVRWTVAAIHRAIARRRASVPATATAMVLLLILGVTPSDGRAQEAAAQPKPAAETGGDVGRAIRELLLPPQPVTLPADAIILPYNPDDPAGPNGATKVLVPYVEYAKLWNRAFPDKPLTPEKLPAQYAIAGASYTTTLVGDEFLTLSGRMFFEVYTDKPLSIPLAIREGVLTQITLDGKPARLQVIQPDAPPTPQAGQPPNPPAAVPNPPANPAGMVVLRLEGKGRKTLEFALRFKLSRSGGWRIVEGAVPVAAATALDVIVPTAKTEVRLGGPGVVAKAQPQPPQQQAANQQAAPAPQADTYDRVTVETKADNETLHSAIAADGSIRLQWRPKVAEAQIDQSLTARSTAVLDVQEDGVRLVWRTTLEFRRGLRDSFTFLVPAGFLVERVTGPNVRGWKSAEENGSQRIDVTLLQAVTGQENITLILSQRAAVGEGAMAALAAPVVSVRDAALHQGMIVLRRSPLLDVRVEDATGLSRADATEQDIATVLAGATEESPLGIRPFQTYRFATVPFQLRFRAAPYVAKTSVEIQSLVKVSDRESRYEARLVFGVENRPRYEVTAELPPKLQVDGVEGPTGLEWTVVTGPMNDVLRVFLPAGQQQFTLLIRGRLPQRAGEAIAAPRLVVRDVDKQSGYLVVQADPAYEVNTEGLRGCESVLMARVFPWLQDEQRRLARVALFHPSSDFAATLRVTPREAQVSAFTITNVRVTPFAVEDTVYLHFRIQDKTGEKDASVREVAFRLPASLRDARFTVPLLKQKTIETIADQPGYVRVKLELQDEVAEQLIVLVEHDRALTAGAQEAPIPIVETGTTDQRFVVLENAGRDEIVVTSPVQLTELNRQQSEWDKLVATLGDKITRAYLVRGTATEPRLTFQTKQRETVETARARIELAKTRLVVDGYGAYRGVQEYQVDNKTEQFLEVELPEGAELWTVRVAGEAVKPTVPPSAANARHVRVPLIKTAPGDLDYTVELKYGGHMRLRGPQEKSRFPLMHTVNIHVEQSQVRLWLPETHQWFDFGGTMRQVHEEGSLTAGDVSYGSNQLERLLSVARGGDDFAKVRASNNLKQLGLAQQNFNDTFRSRPANADLQRELSNSTVWLQQAEQVVTEQEQQPAKAAESDNRSTLSVLCATQPLARAKNVVTQLKGNFDAGLVGAKPADAKGIVNGERGQEFNLRWFDGNQLNAPAKPTAEDEAKPTGKTKVRALETRGEGKTAAIDAEGRSAVTELGKKLANEAKEANAPKDSPQQLPTMSAAQQPEPRTRAGELSDQLERYQMRLQQQQQSATEFSTQVSPVPNAPPGPPVSGPAGLGMPGMPGGATPSSSVSEPNQALPQAYFRGGQGPGGGGGFGSGRMAGGAQGMAGGGSAPAVRVPAAPPVVAVAGMKSLDVELPQRGVEYKFLTPRGEIELDVRAVNTRQASRWMTVAGIGLGLIVVLTGVRFVRFVASRLNRRVLGVLLIVLGFAALVSGILPIFGILVGVIGVICTIRGGQARTVPQTLAA